MLSKVKIFCFLKKAFGFLLNELKDNFGLKRRCFFTFSFCADLNKNNPTVVSRVLDPNHSEFISGFDRHSLKIFHSNSESPYSHSFTHCQSEIDCTQNKMKSTTHGAHGWNNLFLHNDVLYSGSSSLAIWACNKMVLTYW